VKRGLAALVALAWPASALACAACVASAERNRTFFVMTMVLSVLPLALIAGGMWWIARHARGRLAGEFEERDSLPTATPTGAARREQPAPPGLARP
jgi:hypothetical protein